MNRHKDLQDFIAHAQRGDTYSTVREDMERVETYTATTDYPVREDRRSVVLTTTITVAGMYETKQTSGTLTLDTKSIPGEALDAVTGGSASVVQGIQPLTAPFAADDLLSAHRRLLPTL